MAWAAITNPNLEEDKLPKTPKHDGELRIPWVNYPPYWDETGDNSEIETPELDEVELIDALTGGWAMDEWL